MVEKKILYIATQEVVKEIEDGGKKFSNRNWRLLKDIFGENNVTLLMFSNYHEDNINAGIIRIKPYKSIAEKYYNIISGRVFGSKLVEEKIINILRKTNYDYVCVDRSLVGKLLYTVKRIFPNIKIVTFSQNVEEKYFKNKFKNNKILRKIICSIIDRDESLTLDNTDYLITLTERDSNIYGDIYGKKADLVLNMSFRDVFERQLVQEGIYSKEILFIGSNFGPNFEGIKWFVENVMEELKDYKLYIVGKNFEKERDVLARENVEVVGGVSNLEDYYYKNNIMVMPILYGDGQKVKTAEAMMYGKTIFATDEALEGYEVDGVKGIFRCNSKENFVDAIVNYNIQYTTTYQEEVRNLFLSKYSYTNNLNVLLDLFEKIEAVEMSRHSSRKMDV